ncbi:LysM peptidoglycan-binding domain-containing protein [Algoriphagus halophytocola]|uniref:LysM peptidoglycan-binding domain-containing protein n=1 Tax=Algoriphagus halophytocola TaxID=2991499 RepID=A0ABY6ML58_9BACT|nr:MULTISPECIES: LysM peptidoglycan-binding domain-containing protein [unclassified Algoriphagus]UZD23699.1 LysM peptidoglycan-binding domain-containing protein [Algoriphagus sp. TR-M5]WBL44992.1 LysM peptidoglycan-binding domain-containing protein [Algoriphagus sp. TR-M9]
MNNRAKIIWSFILSFLLSSSLAMASSLVSADSVGVERVGDQSFIIHEVEPKETLFGISRRYQAPVGDIVDANPVLKSGLKIGQTIRVPFIPKSELPAGAVLHKVVPGETLFSISKKYGVTVDEVMKSNELKGNDLSVGQSLIIEKAVAETPAEAPEPVVAVATSTEVVKSTPAPEKKAEPAPKKAKPEEKPAPVEKKAASEPVQTSEPMVQGDWVSHEVQVGETLFSIASRYEARVEDLITWNALTSNNLQEGQVLKVGRGDVQVSTVPVIGQPKVVNSVDEMMVEPADENASGGFKNIKETGQAELIEGTGGHKKYLVLHRTAPVGTIMRVKNEENDITIFARVVGTLPETGDNGKLVIKLSQAAFDQLKAVNSRFPVEVMY